jgi:single-stranded DNA-binding protein
MNVTIVQGTLSRPPDTRVLASGATVVSYDVAVRTDEGPAETVPVSWFEPPAAASRLGEGDEVLVTGRTQSRTDVVADTVVRTSARVRSARALEVARARISVSAG